MLLSAAVRRARVRRVLKVTGAVQGVGFRPYVYRAAVRLGLVGGVWNDAGGVTVDAEGDAFALDRLLEALVSAPAPAHVESVKETIVAAPLGAQAFSIQESRGEADALARVPADLATCDTCLAEMLDERDRRHGYPFIACASCGPRYTAVTDMPYDRARTTFDAFTPCAACRAEYEDPKSRRFHAQAIACPDCGPRVWAEGKAGDFPPLARAAAVLRDGGLVAVRGLGGFHLACDARDAQAVARLREAKQRAHKPFAVMFADVAALSAACIVSSVESTALLGCERPIVLLARAPESALADGVSPGLAEVGAFLPGTGLHHLLLRAFGGPLVMTSGNLGGEPIAVSNEEARARLGAHCDLLLLNDRDIAGRADDSVVRITLGAPRLQRRAKGYAAGPFPLGFPSPDVLAVGADLKNTLCVTHGGEAFLSPHVGDLETLESQHAWEDTRVRMERLFGARPTVVAHDLHPGYHGTACALRSGLPVLGVQHHHAHVASCLAENGRTGPVLGVAWDGTGYGLDGTVWGGEILAADLGAFTRVARLRPVALAGGDAAVREGWRMALAHLTDAGLDPARVSVRGWKSVVRMIETGTGVVPTSSMGRLFDAVASLCGVRQESSYEGQAAMELEALAARDEEPYTLPIARDGSLLEMDARPLVRDVVRDVDAGVSSPVISSRFHAALAASLAYSCRMLREDLGLSTVALTGGCFANRRLTELAVAALEKDGFLVLLHARVPPGDGGLALGQAAVAAWRLSHVPGHSR